MCKNLHIVNGIRAMLAASSNVAPELTAVALYAPDTFATMHKAPFINPLNVNNTSCFVENLSAS